MTLQPVKVPASGLATRQTPVARALVGWHLLSLDAPTVAVVWTGLIARASRVALPVSSLAAMFLAVWILYAADRLLDAGALPGGAAELEARHLYHSEHRRGFRVGILGASVVLAPLLLTMPAATMRLYLLLGALLFGWFVLIHVPPVRPGGAPRRLPKELAVGVFFAAAVYVPTVSRVPGLRFALLGPAVLLAGLCSLNCLFIYRWEHGRGEHGRGEDGCEEHGACVTVAAAHPTTRLALRHLRVLALALLVASLVWAVAMHDRLSGLALATAASAGLLLVLDRLRGVEATLLRALADLVLLTPVLALPMLR